MRAVSSHAQDVTSGHSGRGTGPSRAVPPCLPWRRRTARSEPCSPGRPIVSRPR